MSFTSDRLSLGGAYWSLSGRAHPLSGRTMPAHPFTLRRGTWSAPPTMCLFYGMCLALATVWATVLACDRGINVASEPPPFIRSDCQSRLQLEGTRLAALHDKANADYSSNRPRRLTAHRSSSELARLRQCQRMHISRASRVSSSGTSCARWSILAKVFLSQPFARFHQPWNGLAESFPTVP